jgi:hypothetical protein
VRLPARIGITIDLAELLSKSSLMRCCALAMASSWLALNACASPLPPQEVVALCGNAEDAAHCGRLIEEVQLKRLPNLGRRDGSALTVALYPAGFATFNDSDDPVNGRSYSLWDFLDPINAVVLYSTAGESTTFVLLRRTTNRRFDLPAEPKLSPDRQRIVTADVCPNRCVNEIAIWRVAPESLRKEMTWTPPEPWSDAAATWKDGSTLSIEYTPAGADNAVVMERRLSDASWKRVAPE